MNFILTKQFIKGEEQLIASFYELKDAKIFASILSSEAAAEGKKLAYRIYNDFELLHIFNEANLPFISTEDPETFSADLLFNVVIKPTNSIDRKLIASFDDEENARRFIIIKCSLSTNNSTDLFFIFKDKVLIETLNKNKIDIKALKAKISSGNEKGTKFRPTPLPLRPTPPGGPGDYWVDESDEDETKK